MNWRECRQWLEGYFPGARFEWPAAGVNDFDCTEALTISDIWGVFMWGLTYPGDWILSQEPLRTFFEIEGTSAIGARGSVIFGVILLLFLVASLKR